MKQSPQSGFTFIEIIIALALTSMLILLAVSLTDTLDRANRGISNRLEATHSGQATLDYIIRELQTAQNFYLNQARVGSIGYRRYDGSYSKLIVESGVLKRKIYTGDHFITLKETDDIISEGINTLSFRYFTDGVTESPPTTDVFTADQPKMFYHIQIGFSVMVGQAQVTLSSAASTLNIVGHLSSGSTNQVY